MKLYGVIILLVIVGFVSNGYADTIVLQPGPEGYDMFVRDRDGGGFDHKCLEVGGWDDTYYSYIQFDLTDLPTYATSAKIQLYCYKYFDYVPPEGKPAYGNPPPMYIDQITSEWDETTTDWNNKPSSTYLGTILDAPTAAGWCSIDITDLYNAWGDGTSQNYGIALRPTRTDNRFAFFYSSDYSDNTSLRPKLIVEGTMDVTITLQDTIIEVNDIDVDNFKNKNMQNALTNKIMAVIKLVDNGQYEEALDKLQNDILGKTDGCANDGTPDNNDWIEDCASQDQVYPLVIEAIEYLQNM